jgi:hypothetical protein
MNYLRGKMTSVLFEVEELTLGDTRDTTCKVYMVLFRPNLRKLSAFTSAD